MRKAVDLEIKGKIIELLSEKSGQSANGEWRKQEYILETDGQYPKKICFMAWGNKIDQFNIQQGETVAVEVDLESREFNGRWYTDVKAWKVSRNSVGADYFQSTSPKGDDNSSPPSSPQVDDGDMPF